MKKPHDCLQALFIGIKSLTIFICTRVLMCVENIHSEIWMNLEWTPVVIEYTLTLKAFDFFNFEIKRIVANDDNFVHGK